MPLAPTTDAGWKRMPGKLRVVCLLCSVLSSRAASGQGSGRHTTLPPTPLPGTAQGTPETTDGETDIAGFPKRILFDELHIIKSPAHVRRSDLVWLLPLAGAAGAAFATDTRAMHDTVSHDANVNAHAGTASDAIRDGFIGVPVALFGAGEILHQDHAREAGILGGQAMIDAYALGAVVKLIALRERPPANNARGAFFQTSAGWDSSFPSGHSLVAWSSAAVLAGEYNRPWQQATAYLLAGGVSMSRVLAQQHFPSDVLIGSATGWLIGHYVYHAHHRRRP